MQKLIFVWFSHIAIWFGRAFKHLLPRPSCYFLSLSYLINQFIFVYVCITHLWCDFPGKKCDRYPSAGRLPPLFAQHFPPPSLARASAGSFSSSLIGWLSGKKLLFHRFSPLLTLLADDRKGQQKCAFCLMIMS